MESAVTEKERGMDLSAAFWRGIGIRDALDPRRMKKRDEVIGFSGPIVDATAECSGSAPVTLLDCGCGKSYLSFAVNHLLTARGIDARLIGVDTSPQAIRACEETRGALGYDNMAFHVSRAIAFEPSGPVDIVIALHACNTATDEAIAKGIKLRAQYIMVVPCCQNQIRGQLRDDHPLRTMTQFGILKYGFANLLTETLRALILRGVGYDVTMDEIVPPTTTPKNIMIRARRMKSRGKVGLTEYLELSRKFSVRIKLESLLPEVFDNIVR